MDDIETVSTKHCRNGLIFGIANTFLLVVQVDGTGDRARVEHVILVARHGAGSGATPTPPLPSPSRPPRATAVVSQYGSTEEYR